MEHSMRYDGYATFVEGHSRFTYALVDGAPYLMTNDSSSDAPTVDCIPPSTLPFDAILPAVNDATPIPSASIGSVPIECESGNLFKTSFAGIHYAICVSDDSGFTAIASDVTIDVDYLDAPVSIPQIKLEDGSTCGVLAEPTEMTATALALLSGDELPVNDRRKLKTESHMAIQSTCSCKSTPRPCIFYHGLGNEKDEPTVQDSSRHFGWDIINDHAPCCTTIKYAALNTVDFAWTDGSLQKKVCDRALSMSPSSDLGSNKIKDTIVVTHSMGGLISTWIGLSPPMTGSMSSDYLMDFCNGEVRNLMSDLLFDGRSR
ncbi:uncharacterized protein PITG_20882 [Phytophthora infestans T30-4]|uniref:Uncharacterized protein n=1 Tax=Phytophthora infestans (strain T30-4) TaxID=403677 RepID=D0P242_PHYIT|nr:uncharacterized protein PITG_20882 [Phytophthora infestans T30-4]EEY55468.1 conserved hypothetical protein [Phytophthora infestans T30-4]|eukprot:XP_002895630.1 conserved hypothetical protein [Phytophthora infestans T30-4]